MDLELPTELETESKQDFNEEKVKDIKKFFDLANDNVKSATEIFNKCVEMRKKLDSDTKELEKKRIEHEEKCNKELEKIKSMKDQIFQKLKDKKAEIDEEATSIKEEKIFSSIRSIR